jgi:hypothetical protein
MSNGAVILSAVDWDRVKQCPACGAWFIDNTKNGIKERRSRHCTNVDGSTSRRRESKKSALKNRRKEGNGKK